MKKSLIALAVAGAFSASAYAQSSVTLYGRVDVGIQKTNTGTSPMPGAAGTAGEINVVQGSGSRLGFQGAEDLGGGMKAIFQIEHRFNPDTGSVTAPATFWNGRTYVGLSGPWGTLKAGREYTPAFWVGLFSDPWGYDTVGQLGTLTLANSSAIRFPNTINYALPKMGGLSAEVAWVAHESTSANAKNGFGANAQYSAGPLWFGVAYEDNAQTTPNDTKLWALGASYKFGPAKVIGNWAQGKDKPTNVKRTNYALAATFTVGAGELRAGVSSLKTDNPTPPDPTLRKIGLGYHHNLSKRTTLYVDYGRGTLTGATAKTGFDAGVKHNF